MKLKELEKEVRGFLISNPQTRASDDLLYAMLIEGRLQRMGKSLHRISAHDYLLHYRKYGLPTIESVGRCRRKILAVGKQKWCDVVLCVPFVDIPAACRSSRDAKIAVAAQNMHYEEKGAYTGEVSAEMLKELGVKYVVIGHSERREYYGETDKTVNLKVKKALEVGLRPIICVGETLEQREYDITREHITMQVKIALADVPADKVRKIVFAYEPIWAIGTGKTATAEQAEEVCELIRSVIRTKYGARIARAVTIQYGGSMNPKNAAELLAKPDVDGGLIGGASLKTEDFVAVINAANQ